MKRKSTVIPKTSFQNYYVFVVVDVQDKFSKNIFNISKLEALGKIPIISLILHHRTIHRWHVTCCKYQNNISNDFTSRKTIQQHHIHKYTKYFSVFNNTKNHLSVRSFICSHRRGLLRDVFISILVDADVSYEINRQICQTKLKWLLKWIQFR